MCHNAQCHFDGTITISIMTLSITTFIKITVSIKGLFVTLSINDAQSEWHTVSYLIFWVLKRLAPFGAKIILILINPRLLAPNYLEHFIGSAPPPFILDPLLWIGSAYSFVYLNSCLWLNKWLMNLTSLRQHHLQYNNITTLCHYPECHYADCRGTRFGQISVNACSGQTFSA